ncbi:MAG: hypothetical protein EAZ78_25485 [Oscillatoriales cyanobacterium]|uniref:Uncharacterized protein n=1 Tax=Microcoleus anatoxicus PTRS2 TaxID=2705321 RepID=A0ABU8YKJ5_9CYAN|nr:MAG: hypothetical protein EA000_23210 [Oscillatoriales cyanobacterium]TAE97674.1 MAG: hypothetical protein EAZ78_25485 [Oscillatoriales cyanobacterium]TAF47119.1 MAG: hypothetical protein EAZ68_02390 [Oscillatoriales cyanobacterium]
MNVVATLTVFSENLYKVLLKNTCLNKFLMKMEDLLSNIAENLLRGRSLNQNKSSIKLNVLCSRSVKIEQTPDRSNLYVLPKAVSD